MPTLAELLDGVLAVDPSAPALEYQRAWFTWGEIRAAIDALDACLARAAVPRGSRIGVVGHNRPPAFVAALAVVRASCIVTVNALLPTDRLRSDLKKLQLPAVIGERGDFDREGVLEALRETGTAVIVLDHNLTSARLLQDGRAPPPVEAPSEMLIEMLTSGTTGAPKRIPLQRRAFEASFVSAMSYEKGRTAEERPKLRSGVELLATPITHIGGLWGALSSVLSGRQSCLMERFTVQEWRDAIVRHRPKVAGAVPAALRMILDADLPKEDLSSLIALRTGAAPLDPAVTQAFMERYGLPVLQAYGATEFSGAVAGWTLGAFTEHYKDKVGSVGRFQPGVEGRVVDPGSGEGLPAGEEGVLEMRSAQFGNGGRWLRATDRAVIDVDGFLYIKGRADNAINRGGFKVHPDDVVAVLEQHPAVREAVVVGIADARLGEAPVAAIMLKARTEPPSSEELTAFAKSRLMPYQVPTRFLVVDEVPRTSSFKPALMQVRALFDDPPAPSASRAGT